MWLNVLSFRAYLYSNRVLGIGRAPVFTRTGNYVIPRVPVTVTNEDWTETGTCYYDRKGDDYALYIS